MPSKAFTSTSSQSKEYFSRKHRQTLGHSSGHRRGCLSTTLLFFSFILLVRLISHYYNVVHTVNIMFSLGASNKDATLDDAQQHPHNGILQPFPLGDPEIEISAEAEAVLKSGQAYQTLMQLSSPSYVHSDSDSASTTSSSSVSSSRSSESPSGGVTSHSSAVGRGLVIQDVHAPVRIVWKTILDFDRYRVMVPKTIESHIYHQQTINTFSSQEEQTRLDGTDATTEPANDRQHKDDDATSSSRRWGGRKKKKSSAENKQHENDLLQSTHTQEVIAVCMKVGFPPFIQLQFFIRHVYDPMQNSLIWTLDYDRKSDLNDSVGFWYAIPHPDYQNHESCSDTKSESETFAEKSRGDGNLENEWTRLYYSVEVSMFPWIPSFVVDFMRRQALTEATAWVKQYSEEAYQLQKQQQQQQDQIKRTNYDNHQHESDLSQCDSATLHDDAPAWCQHYDLSTKKDDNHQDDVQMLSDHHTNMWSSLWSHLAFQQKDELQRRRSATTDSTIVDDVSDDGSQLTQSSSMSSNQMLSNIVPKHGNKQYVPSWLLSVSPNRRNVEEDLGLTRYALVTAVVALAMYNLHLYLSL